ncbi:AK9 [Mytilus edulis]|uniref:AK9 n=1 Tax=Mytilus edulis TaxID=6550 RepID=A0A8S3PZ21_MYTED|nr:AK9 [Mytilus edulis]
MEIHTTESSNSAIHHTISDFLVQNDITLQQLLDYVKSMKISTNPKILMSLQQHKFKRKKRNAGGSTSIQQYCVKKGAPVKNSLLSLCGECAVTTLLPQDRYPRKLNEAVCDNTDLTCLSFSGRPQGACIPGIINLTFLRRRPGSCRMMIRTGEVVDVDEWEPYTQRVRTANLVLHQKNNRGYMFGRMANRFVEEYGLVRLSIGEAMRRVMLEQPKSDLSKQLVKHVTKGLTVPDELAVQALDVCLLEMRSQTRGYILDGFPTTMKQVELMTERCIIPVRVIELEINSKEVMVRGLRDRMSSARMLPLHDSAQILAIKLAAYNKEVSPIREYYEQEHMNFIKVSGERSKWWVWNRSLEIAHESVKKIQTYLQRISDANLVSYRTIERMSMLKMKNTLPLEEVSIDEILEMQREEQLVKQEEEERKKKAMLERGLQPHSELHDDMF